VDLDTALIKLSMARLNLAVFSRELIVACDSGPLLAYFRESVALM
jgi:hypothetical protein